MSMYAARKLYVDARLTDAGDLVIDGQDLNDGEYEYAMTVAAAQVPVVLGALGGTPDDDVLALLAAQGTDIVTRGELTWLKSLGLEPSFWCRREFRD
ncbi:hypothetical protein [Yinghuangia soli]|uniref:Uncharacterized protein n=1 Tax=Yinghuangia soli TaxID=2908204 RepID=A0AA41Q5Y4_9ACTN|nr:hypothetical protein [Yinghuangia soli]MCF2531575.1 hypothetical protein [Yinghuangia soli]